MWIQNNHAPCHWPSFHANLFSSRSANAVEKPSPDRPTRVSRHQKRHSIDATPRRFLLVIGAMVPSFRCILFNGIGHNSRIVGVAIPVNTCSGNPSLLFSENIVTNSLGTYESFIIVHDLVYTIAQRHNFHDTKCLVHLAVLN
jgi:hypothetical protein